MRRSTEETRLLTWPAILQGLGIGLLVSLLFSLVPLLDVRHVKPSLLLRDEARGADQKQHHEEHERKLARWLYGEELKEISPLPDFYKQLQESYGEIARSGGGTSVRIDQDDLLMRQLLVLAFGKQWEKELARVGRTM